MRKMPVILVDTCAFEDWARADLRLDYGPQQEGGRPAPTSRPASRLTQETVTQRTIRGLLDSGNNIILPRRIFTEVFPTSDGRLDMMADGKGGVTVNLAIPAEKHLLPERMYLQEVFQQLQEEGKLVCYASTQAMLEDKDYLRPYGRMMIVDTTPDQAYSPQGTKAGSSRDYFRQVHDAQALQAQKEETAQRYADSGDHEIIRLCAAMAKDGGDMRDVMLVTRDRGLRDALYEKPEIRPWSVNSLAPLQALQKFRCPASVQMLLQAGEAALQERLHYPLSPEITRRGAERMLQQMKRTDAMRHTGLETVDDWPDEERAEDVPKHRIDAASLNAPQSGNHLQNRLNPLQGAGRE